MSPSGAFDVAIIGLGPVGCLTALLLAWRGLRVAAIERDATVYALPRAAVLDGEIVRALQPTGLAEHVAALLQTLRPGERAGFTNGHREWLFGRDTPAFGLNGWQPSNFFLQPELEGFLREQVLAHPRITAQMPATLTEFKQDDSGVTLTFKPAGEAESRQVRADWLIACDGAASFTRRALGIEWRSLGYDRDWLVVDAHIKPGHTLGNATLQVCDPERLTTYVATKDPNRRWEFRLLPHETREEMLAPARIRSLLDTWTPPGTYEIVRAAVYQFHAATAPQWRVGRILIAGDAAHQMPPFLGQGMNTGMRDAINLAWKLPLVVNGTCTDALLDSYQAERQAHAEDLVDWAVSIGRLMEHLAEVERASRERRAAPEAAPDLQSSGYGQGRGLPPLKAGILVASQAATDTATGHLFAQPVVRDDTGREFRLDDRLGDQFALVATRASALALTPRNQALLDRLGSRSVSLEGLTPVRGEFDRIFRKTDVVLVRPDRYIFGHGDERLDANGLVEALARALPLR